MEYAVKSMRSGFCCPAFLGALRHSLNSGGQAPCAPPPPTPACASLARAFLVHHTMAQTLEPPVTVAPTPVPAYLTEQPSDSPSPPPFGDVQGVPPPGPSVGPPVLPRQQGAGPNGVRPLVSQGRADGPRNMPPEGKRSSQSRDGGKPLRPADEKHSLFLPWVNSIKWFCLG